MKSRFDDAAAREFHEAIAYSDEHFGLALEFIQAVEKAVAEISRDHGRFRSLGDGFHLFRMNRFPYNLIYHINPSEAEIVIDAVAHKHRRPGYWKDRPSSGS